MNSRNSQPQIIAHRGGNWPGTGENTLAAFIQADRAGIRWLETDVHASADGVLFAVHDADLTRIAGREVRIADLPASELDTVDLIDGGRPPRLTDLFEALPEAMWNIDVKAPISEAPMVRTLNQHPARDRVRLGSFDSKSMRRLRRALPGIPTSTGMMETAQFLFGPRPSLPSGVDALQLPASYKGLHLATPRVLKRAHAAGAELHIWTVNDPIEMRFLRDLGVDAIVTDEVALAQTVLA